MRHRSNRRARFAAAIAGTAGLAILAMGLATAGSPAEAHAGSRASGRTIEALCHAWTESPCILNVRGTLHSARTGGPLAGKQLRFVAEGEVICVSRTDRHGRAACSGVVPSGRSIAESGYGIVFDGEGKYVSGSARSGRPVRSEPERSL